MKKLLTILAYCLLIAMFSCTKPSGVEITEYFALPSHYDQLYVSDGMEITVTSGGDQIVVTGDENAVSTVKVECSGGRLRITRSDFSVFRLMKCKVELPYNEDLREVEATLYGSFETPYTMQAKKVKLTASSFADINVKYILTDDLTISASNNSDINADVDVNNLTELSLDHSDAEITGSTENLRLDLRGNSELKKRWGNGGYDFDCTYCYGNMNDSKAYLHCYDKLSVALANESALHFTGHPNYSESSWDETSSLVDEN